MRILVLSPVYPTPTDNGAKRRIRAFIHNLSMSHEITLAALRQDVSCKASPDRNNYLWKDCTVDLDPSSHWTIPKAVFSGRSYREVKFWSPRFHRIMTDLLESGSYDVVWVNFLNMASYLEGWLETCSLSPFLLLDQHNVDTLYWRSFLSGSKNFWWRIFALMEYKKAERLQSRWFSRFNMVLSVSPEGLQATERYVDDDTELCLAPNGVDLQYFYPVASESLQQGGARLVFGGSMDAAMNEDGVVWFVEKVFPLIRDKMPDARFCIVGRNPSARVRRLVVERGVEVTGGVPDVRSYYEQADVFVVPMRLGGGTKLKTLEAMAMGLPIVSTDVGVQGLDVESGKQLYIASEPQSFAKYAVDLIQDRARATEMGREARLLVEHQYSWTSIVENVERRLVRLVDGDCRSEQ